MKELFQKSNISSARQTRKRYHRKTQKYYINYALA